MAEAPFPYIAKNGTLTRVYRCCNCKRNFEWGNDCEWFGSYKDAESYDWGKVMFACSGECAKQLRKAKNETRKTKTANDKANVRAGTKANV